MTPLDERDFITLNAYLDDELTTTERVAFEKRLAAEPALRQELDSLSTTVNVLKLAERVRAPRNFTLDPKVYGKSAPRSFLDRLGMIGLPQLVAVGGTLVAAIICAAAVIYGSQIGAMTGATSAEMPMPASDTAQEAMPESAEIAMDVQEAEETEAPEEEATEAPAEEEETMTILATEEGVAESLPFDPLESPEPDFDSGGQGGAAGGQGGAGGAGPVTSGGEISPSVTPNTALVPEQAEEGDAFRNAGNDGAEPPTVDDAQADEAAEAQAYSAQPTDEAGKEPEIIEPPSIPIIPIAIVVLVLALGSGVLIARFARRR